MCLPEVQKMLWSTGGEREGENKRGGGYAERATFHEGLEHFVKYYVFTKNKMKPSRENTSIPADHGNLFQVSTFWSQDSVLNDAATP